MKKKWEFGPLKVVNMILSSPHVLQKEERFHKLVRHSYPAEIRKEAIRKYAKEMGYSVKEVMEDGMYVSLSSAFLWMKEPVIYEIDDTFAEELLGTRNAISIYNLFLNLPYSTFCVDFSKAPKLSKRFDADSMMISVEKCVEEDEWAIHVSRFGRDIRSNEIFSIKNDNTVLASNSILAKTGEDVITEQTAYFISNFLTYLCLETEADIEDSVGVSGTKRKSDTQMRFSETKKIKVGFTVGQMLRNWYKQNPQWQTEGKDYSSYWATEGTASFDEMLFKREYLKWLPLKLYPSTSVDIIKLEENELMRRKTTKISKRGYLPLYWAQVQPGKEIPCSMQDYLDGAEYKDSRFVKSFQKTAVYKKMSSSVGPTSAAEWARTVAIIHMWSYDKQVFKVSPALGKKILDTMYSIDSSDGITNAWDFLPCKTVCLDFSDCPELIAETKYQCSYIHVFKEGKANVAISMSFGEGNSSGGNRCVLGGDEARNEFYDNNPNYKPSYNPSFECDADDEEDEYDEEPNAMQRAIIAILNYLSNDDADIEESEESIQNYQKPIEGMSPENKMSEVREWLVGYNDEVKEEMLLPSNVETNSVSVGKWASLSNSSDSEKKFKIRVEA